MVAFAGSSRTVPNLRICRERYRTTAGVGQPRGGEGDGTPGSWFWRWGEVGDGVRVSGRCRPTRATALHRSPAPWLSPVRPAFRWGGRQTRVEVALLQGAAPPVPPSRSPGLDGADADDARRRLSSKSRATWINSCNS